MKEDSPQKDEQSFGFSELAELICEIRGGSHLLRYDEYEILKFWVEASNKDFDRLALVLEEIVPPWVEKQRDKSFSPHLKNIHKKVLGALKR